MGGWAARGRVGSPYHQKRFPSQPAAMGAELVSRRTPRQTLRLPLVRDPGPDEGMEARPAQLHRLPLALLAHRVDLSPQAVPQGEVHLVDHPRHDLFGLPHQALPSVSRAYANIIPQMDG